MNNSAGYKRHTSSTLRQVVAVVLGCLMAGLVANTWLIAGLFAPFSVRGGSMAPHLLGEHRTWQCGECKQTFTCGVESLPTGGRNAICPECGAAQTLDCGTQSTGDRVFVDRSAYNWRRPRRWEMVVLHQSDAPHSLCVKRVVGLPNEVIEIQGGDLLVDGRIARKSIAELRTVSVPVAGSHSRDRWSGDGWQLADGVFVHHAQSDKVDWLSYQHQEPTLRQGFGANTPILDGSSYDHAESRRLAVVPDLMLNLEFQTAEAGNISFRLASDEDDWRVHLDVAEGQLELVRNGTPLTRQQYRPLDGSANMWFALADHRVHLAINGKVLTQYDYDPADRRGHAIDQVVAIGTDTAGVRVCRMRVFRDVYYTSAGVTQYRLGEQEYLVLGDNSPHSLDGRHWTRGVAASALLGPVIFRQH